VEEAPASERIAHLPKEKLPSNAGAHLSLGANGLCRVLLCMYVQAHRLVITVRGYLYSLLKGGNALLLLQVKGTMRNQMGIYLRTMLVQPSSRSV